MLDEYFTHIAKINPILDKLSKACVGPVEFYNKLAKELEYPDRWYVPDLAGLTEDQVYVQDDGERGVAAVGYDAGGFVCDSCFIPESTLVTDYEPVIRKMWMNRVAKDAQEARERDAVEKERRAGRSRIFRGELST